MSEAGSERRLAHELEDFLRQVESELSSEYGRIRKRAAEDPGTAGDEGEENWAAFLRAWLPDSYTVVTKGRILGVNGEASPQMDVLVLKPSYPPALRNKKVYLAGGVAAAFECKTTLKKHHLRDAVATAVRLQEIADPEATPSRGEANPFRELHSPIAYGLLAHSHSWASVESGRALITDVLTESVWDSSHPREVLDLTCVADLGFWRVTKWPYRGPALGGGWWDNDGNRETYPHGYASCGFMGPLPPSDPFSQATRDFAEIPVAQLCVYLTTRLAREDSSMRPIAEYFRKVGMQGISVGMTRPFSVRTVYSPGVQEIFNAEHSVDWKMWSPWRHVLD